MYEEFVACRYCKYAQHLSHSPLQMLCEKKGVVNSSEKCRKFELDMLSIQPPCKKRNLSDKSTRLTKEDFAL